MSRRVWARLLPAPPPALPLQPSPSLSSSSPPQLAAPPPGAPSGAAAPGLLRRQLHVAVQEQKALLGHALL